MNNEIDENELCKKICEEITEKLIEIFIIKMKKNLSKNKISNSGIYSIIINTVGNFIFQVSDINNNSQNITDENEIKKETSIFLNEIMIIVNNAIELNNNKSIFTIQ